MGVFTSGVVSNRRDHKFMSMQQLYDRKQPKNELNNNSNNDKNNKRAKSTITTTRTTTTKTKQERRRVRRSALDPSATDPVCRERQRYIIGIEMRLSIYHTN